MCTKFSFMHFTLAVWLSGIEMKMMLINVVALRWARLVLGWVTELHLGM